jgi:8-oxo-dGTP pyrophosphatase MutT (NUDIX family)
VPGLARRLAGILPNYAKIAWFGLVSPRLEGPLTVHQGVILGERDPLAVLLTVRHDLRGWELPGGHASGDESGEAAVCREILEETGVEVRVARVVGEYVRTGFRPHTARVYLCHPIGGQERPSGETPVVRWFPVDAVPDTLLPWYRGPLADALAGGDAPVRRDEHWGLRDILAGIQIDLRMRLTNHRAGEKAPGRS